MQQFFCIVLMPIEWNDWDVNYYLYIWQRWNLNEQRIFAGFEMIDRVKIREDWFKNGVPKGNWLINYSLINYYSIS